MVADTIQTNIAVFLYTVFLFSCSETVIIQESDLIDGVTVQQFIRDSQYTGIIEIYYPNNQLKSLREYSGGKKYGKHKGWWENGNQQYEYYFDNDQNIGRFIKEKPRVWTITSFSDSGVRLKFVGVTQPGKQWEVRTQVIREIKIAFDNEGIKIPYNQIRVIN